MTIPASELVNVLPGVLSAGGAAVALNGLILTNSTTVPIGTVRQFATAADVSDYFGPSSAEASMASVYFAGYVGKTQAPGNLLFSQYPTVAVAGYNRSGSFAGVSLADLQATPTGTLTFTVDGVVEVSTSIDLSAATSFSNAATIITAAFSGNPLVTYNSQLNSFEATSTTTGAASTVSFGTGALSDDLKFTAATGAVLSAGAAAYTPAAAMDAIVAIALNWASFTSTFEPLTADKLAFGTWTSQQSNRYAYVAWDTDVNAVNPGNSTDYGSQAKALGLSGSLPVTGDPAVAAALGITMTDMVRPLAAFVMGYAASLDFDATNGRATLAYRAQGGLVTGVTNATIANTLIGKGYNFYGAYATSSQNFMFMQPGQIGGEFKWADSFFNQIWMNGTFQNTLMSLLANSGSLPYNPQGYSTIESALADPINLALNFGAIRAGVTLSGDQIVAVNAAAGKNIASVVATRGWYLNIVDPGAAARVNRESPNMTFFYADGGSIQKIEMASINIQ
jgi:hypothetical protein